jgi:hypothetical protein
VLLLIAFVLALPACGGSISGQVFLDADGDGIHDSGEIGIPNAQLSVTRDGKEVARHYSDTSGYFDIPIRRRAGQVCITTDLSFSEANIAFIRQSMDISTEPQTMKVSPPKAMKTAKAATATDDQDHDGVYDSADNCPSIANANQQDTDDDGVGDSCEESEDDAPNVTAETPDSTATTQGWSGAKYCHETKIKGFEVDIPVVMSHEAAIANLPERSAVKCYAGNACELHLFFPDGCKLNTIYLPEGLAPDSAAQSGMSFDASVNSVDVDRNAGVEGGGTSKAVTESRPTLSVSTYRMVTLSLKAAEDIDIGTTDVSLKLSAECPGQSLELPDIPIQLIRDFQVQSYWHVETLGELMSEQQIVLIAGIENQGMSTISFGDVTVIPPEGSEISNIPQDCFNNVTRVICRISNIPGGTIATKSISLKLPKLDPSLPSGETDTYDLKVTFFAPGMEKSAETTGEIVVKQP